jgi:hypothetical protein
MILSWHPRLGGNLDQVNQYIFKGGALPEEDQRELWL